MQTADCLKDTIFKNKHITTKGKMEIYKALVRPVLTYEELRTEAKTKSNRNESAKIYN